MHLDPNAQVYGSDGHIGRATQLIVHPIRRRVTHLVVRAEGVGGQERLVPIDAVRDTSENRIDLDSTRAHFKRYEPFTETHFIEVEVPAYLDDGAWDYSGWTGMGWPYSASVGHSYPDEVDLIPEGELALRRGMRVDASDGHVGRIDEFVVEPDSGRIGHLVMRQGHVFGEKDVFIPVQDIEKMEDDRVLLKLSKHQVEALVHIPVRRLWEEKA